MATKYPSIDTVHDILLKVKIKDGKLTEEQVKKLTKLKSKDDSLLTLKNRPFLAEIIGMLCQLGFEDTYQYLKSNQKSSNQDIIKESSLMKEAKLHYYLDLTSWFREKANEEESIYECKRCKGKRVKTELRQLRRADEPATEINTCKDCGFSWRG